MIRLPCGGECIVECTINNSEEYIHTTCQFANLFLAKIQLKDMTCVYIQKIRYIWKTDLALILHCIDQLNKYPEKHKSVFLSEEVTKTILRSTSQFWDDDRCPRVTQKRSVLTDRREKYRGRYSLWKLRLSFSDAEQSPCASSTPSYTRWFITDASSGIKTRAIVNG